ncbi:hypothetical protein ELE36_14260 [Pseudolysobacter antarcticus]|uniref:Calx-beta domain-containing protein n=1 Tax=Pseudolysobacter antarcticus TaxID=2511995 RepID=A0A411HLM9_9GAMM|nr:FG-GAP-like repeat-containing protein [Pseudolysobacter antarcticus]QBB71425.1 hypothetical protein ELE36_14260 [Pseudolysobacter antarcticus]
MNIIHFLRGVPRRFAAFVFGICATLPAFADSSTLTISAASVHVDNAPTTLYFPITRSGDISYDTVLNYHTVDGSAMAGIDYTANTGSVSLLSGSSSASIPVTITPSAPTSASNSFKMLLDSTINLIAPGFAAHVETSLGFDVYALSTADLNGDGKPDLAIVSYGSDKVSFLLNTTPAGAATPSFGAVQSINAGCAPQSIITADINGDGKPDVVFACPFDNKVTLLMNTTATGASTTSFATQVFTVAGPSSLKATDLNGDNKLDLIVTDTNNYQVVVMLNSTTVDASSASFFGTQAFATGMVPDAITSTDINGDGKPDLVVSNRLSNSLSVLLNTTANGAATASFAAQQVFATGTNPVWVSAIDINGDGKPDLAVANYGSSTFSILLNTTTTGAAIPSFAPQQIFPTGSHPTSIVSADVNSDGKTDLLVTNSFDNTLSVFSNYTAIGSSTAGFTINLYATGFSPQSGFAIDLNADGRLDLLTVNASGGDVSVLMNTTVPPALSFASMQNLGTGGYTNGVTSADINGDGKLDLIEVDRSDNTVSVFINTTPAGSATTSYAPRRTFATSSLPWAVAVADLNGDGKPDIAVANFFGSSVSVLTNQTATGATTASFSAQATFNTGSSPISIAITDINGDGKLDILVADAGANDVAVLRNTTTTGAATPSFAAYLSLPAGGAPSAVASADLNGDGKSDIVVTNKDDGTVSVFQNTTTVATTPTFAAQQILSVGSQPYSVAIADFNGDGKRDVVVANYASSTVSILLNTTTAPGATVSLAAQQTFDGGNPYAVTTADINGDGKPDVIVAVPGNSTAAVLLNTSASGTLNFASPMYLSIGGSPTAIATTDANSDGRVDIVSTNGGSNSLSILLNSQILTNLAGSPATGTIVHDLIVTPSAGENGSISQSSPQTVAYGTSTSFTVTPLPNYVATVVGTCGGTLLGTTYTTAAITANCTVIASFAAVTHIVMPSADAHGSISPNMAQNIDHGSTTMFTIMPDTGYSASVSGTCGGTLVDATYTTNAITTDCSVVASFTLKSYLVTPSVGDYGSISPDTPQNIDYGATTSFMVTPNAGFIVIVGGTCGGTLVDSTYTTNTITANCTVAVTFSDRIFADGFEQP